MASLNEIVSMLADRSGKTFNPPLQKELKFIVRYWAITVLRNSLQNHALDRRFFYSSFTMPLKKISEVDCVTYGCQLRTIDLVPKPIRANNILFDYVGSADLKSPFSYRFFPQLEVMEEGSKYTGGEPTYLYVDNYIFIKNPPTQSLKRIGLLYIPQDVTQANAFKCDVQSCASDNEEFPLSADLIQTLINGILKTELSFQGHEGVKSTEVNVDDK